MSYLYTCIICYVFHSRPNSITWKETDLQSFFRAPWDSAELQQMAEVLPPVKKRSINISYHPLPQEHEWGTYTAEYLKSNLKVHQEHLIFNTVNYISLEKLFVSRFTRSIWTDAKWNYSGRLPTWYRMAMKPAQPPASITLNTVTTLSMRAGLSLYDFI